MSNSRGQVSFEYIVLFSVLLIVFIIVGSITLIGLNKVKKIERDGQRLTDTLKAEVITASLSETDYKSTFKLPSNIGSKDYEMFIYGDKDNMVVVKTKDNSKQVAKSYLPVVKNVLNSPFTKGETLEISKKNNEITIRRAS
jgi:uncharacterized protein (UPF0333 family)